MVFSQKNIKILLNRYVDCFTQFMLREDGIFTSIHNNFLSSKNDMKNLIVAQPITKILTNLNDFFQGQ